MLISWNTTNLCNLKCPHCYRDAGRQAADELTTEEGKALLQEMKRAGFHVVVFSGGEPLLRPDIPELIAFARDLGLRPVLGTNGILLLPEMVRCLQEAGAAAVGISLDSLDSEKHDHFRGFPGAWQATREGMENCRQAGLPFQIHTTVFPWNYQEVGAISKLAVAAGARGHHVFFFVPTGRGKSHEESLQPEAAEKLLRELLESQQQLPIEIKPTCAPQFMRIAQQRQLPNRFKRGCLAGIAYCIIGSQGEVYPCPYMDLQVGNVRQQPFAEIWQHNEVLKQLRSEKYQGYCGICAYRRLCGGCRARSFAVNKGNYMAGDPSCLYRKEQEQRLAPLAEILLLRLQEGFPMVAEPYKDLAGELDASEQEVMEALRWLQAKGVIRRLGATFDSRKLGYTGTLCAAKVPPERVPEVAAVVNASPGVTHNYLRENEYNLWFTLSARSESELNQTIEQLKLNTGLQEIISMPAEHIFKLAVNFSKEDLEGVFTGGAGCYQGFAG